MPDLRLLSDLFWLRESQNEIWTMLKSVLVSPWIIQGVFFYYELVEKKNGYIVLVPLICNTEMVNCQQEICKRWYKHCHSTVIKLISFLSMLRLDHLSIKAHSCCWTSNKVAHLFYYHSWRKVQLPLEKIIIVIPFFVLKTNQ